MQQPSPGWGQPPVPPEWGQAPVPGAAPWGAPNLPEPQGMPPGMPQPPPNFGGPPNPIVGPVGAPQGFPPGNGGMYPGVARPPQVAPRRPASRRRTLLTLLALLLVIVVITAAGLVLSEDTHPNSIAGQSTPTATDTAALSPTATPQVVSALTIQGTQIMDADGKNVTLIGATRSSLEYSCQGDGHFEVADFQAMHAWGMNVVRIPLWSKLWLHQDPADSCPTYEQTVETAIAHAESVGLYVIVDLHWNAPDLSAPYTNPDGSGNHQYNMPDTTHDVQFWHDMAVLYHNDPHVIFELYAEPHDVTWSVWLNGGSVTAKNGITYQAIGMQALVDDVRALAPNNIIIVSGLNWGYDLQLIPSGYAIKGTNILYGSHPFSHSGTTLYQPSDWERAFGATAAKYAVVATEFGSYDCGTSYNAQAIRYFNQHHISWMAWEWGLGPCNGVSGPYLISSWSGTPSVPYGQYIHDQMANQKATVQPRSK